MLDFYPADAPPMLRLVKYAAVVLQVVSLVAMFFAGYMWGLRRFYRWRASFIESLVADVGKLREHEARRDRAHLN